MKVTIDERPGAPVVLARPNGNEADVRGHPSQQEQPQVALEVSTVYFKFLLPNTGACFRPVRSPIPRRLAESRCSYRYSRER